MKCPEGLVMSVTAAAIAAAKNLSADETELLAAVATQFGDTLTTLAIAKSCGEKQ